MTRRYDESLSAIQEMQQAGTAIYKVEDMEFGRRLAMERELELEGPDGRVPGMWSNVIWDESGAFVIYPTLLGIKGRLLLPRYGKLDIGMRLIPESSLSGEYSHKSCFEVVGKG